jgi:excisionase family DNA binding protein
MTMNRKVRIGELSQYLSGKSIHTLYKLVEQNRIPFERLGRDLFFDLDNIDQWMRRQGNAQVLSSESDIENGRDGNEN